MSSNPSKTQEPGMADPVVNDDTHRNDVDPSTEPASAPIPVTTRGTSDDGFDLVFNSNEPHTPIADKYATSAAGDVPETHGSMMAEPAMAPSQDGDNFEFSSPDSLELNRTPRASMRASSGNVSPETAGALVPAKTRGRFPYKQSFEKKSPSSESSSSPYDDAVMAFEERDSTKWQKQRKCYHAIITALGIICIGTLIPLIYLVVHRDKCSAEYSALKLSHAHSIPTISAAAFGVGESDTSVYAANNIPAPFAILDSTIEAILSNKTLQTTFHGLDYARTGMPDCSFSPLEVAQDVATISKVAKNVRVYSNECDQAGMVLSAVSSLKLDLGVVMGVQVSDDASITAQQINSTISVLDYYEPSLVQGIVVGSKALERGEVAEGVLIDYIKLVRQEVQQRELNISISTSQTLEKWSPALVDAVDVVDVNVYSFYAGESSEHAAAWTKTELVDEAFKLMALAPAKKLSFSEMGWPSTGGSVAQAVADRSNAQAFMQNWVCSIAPELDSDTTWYYAQAFDTPSPFMSEDSEREWESHWGIFDAARNLKYPLPHCDLGA